MRLALPPLFRRALAGLVLAGAVAGTVACDKRPPPKEAPPEPSATVDPEELRELAVASALASVRSRLPLAAPEWRLQPLATGRRLLVRLKEETVEAYEAPSFKLLFEQPLDSPRAVVEIAGGSVVAVGQKDALRIEQGKREPSPVLAPVWIPGTVLVPERRNPDVLFGVERTTRSLWKQPLAAESDAGPRRGESLPIEDYDGGPIAVMRDGALLYRGKGGVRRAMPGRRPVSLSTSFVPWRLLPSRRVDHAWAVAADGRVELWLVGERILAVKSFSLGEPPFDVAASSDHLAAVTVKEGAGVERTFTLRVFSNEGNAVLERVLSPGPPARSDDWAARAVQDRHVVVSDADAFVAVGGPGALRVFSLPEGKELLQR